MREQMVDCQVCICHLLRCVCVCVCERECVCVCVASNQGNFKVLCLAELELALSRLV